MTTRAAHRGRFLVVTFEAGGNVQPALGLARQLAARGHEVRVLADRTLRARVERTGSSFRALPAEVEWDPSVGRAIEDQWESWMARVLYSPILGEAVLAEADRASIDVLLIDCMLRGAACAAEAAGLPAAVLVHSFYGHWAGRDEDDDPSQELELVNQARIALGLPRLPVGTDLPTLALWNACARVLVALPEEFEDPSELPANVRFIGPVFEDGDDPGAADLPWPASHPDPLVVVSFSTTYMHQERAIERVLHALEGLGTRVLVTSGLWLGVAEVAAPSWAIVRPYVPHAEVLPKAALVITHAGMGTVMASLRHGVPMVCMPMGRDQHLIAARVQAVGAGRTVAPDASVEMLRAVIVEAMGSRELRSGALRMAEIASGYGDGARAIDELELLLGSAPQRSTND